jgi:hypothetical protein
MQKEGIFNKKGLPGKTQPLLIAYGGRYGIRTCDFHRVNVKKGYTHK